MLPRALEIVNNPAGWSELTTSPTATTYKKSTEFGIDTAKIVSFLQFPCEIAARYAYDNWVNLIQAVSKMRETRILKEFSDGSRLRYDVSPSFGPVSSRDICLYSSLQQLDPKT